MSINRIKRKDKEYLYFKVNGSKRFYLGTSDVPRKERIKEAIKLLNKKIEKCTSQIEELERYLPYPYEIEEADIGYRLVAFDLDGVIYEKPWLETKSVRTAVSTWDILFQELGFYNVHEKLRQNYEEGIFKSYSEWTEAACNTLKSLGLDRTTFEKIINKRSLVPGATEVFKTLHNKNVITAIISGSFDALAQRAKRELGIKYTFAHCTLNFDNSGSLKSWNTKPTDYEDKVEFIQQIAKENKIPLEECAYMGDDVNDLGVFKIVGRSIAFNATKFIVQREADVVIESRNLKSVIPFLYKEG